MHRSRYVSAALVAVAALGACSTSSPGHGTGAGEPSTPIVSSSVTTAGSSSFTPATSPSATAPKSSASRTTTTKPPPSSASSSASAGGSTYTGRGSPNTWCGSSQLAVTAAEPPGGDAAGHTGVVLRFLNNSHHRCILYGYPGVDGTNGGGHSIAHASRTLDGYLGGCRCSSLRGVLVKPGQVASALVEGDIGDGTNCDRFRGLLVIAPNTYNSTPLRLAPHSCDFQVHPVVPGTNGEG